MKIAVKFPVGYSLDQIPNDITQNNASFESNFFAMDSVFNFYATCSVSVCLLALFFGKTRFANVMTDVITFWDKDKFCRRNVLQEQLSISEYHDD